METIEFDTVLQIVIAAIRNTIAEDWIATCAIDARTRLGDDLEIESIEFVRIAEALGRHFGPGINLAGWLAGRDIDELINLTPGALADHIAYSLARV